MAETTNWADDTEEVENTFIDENGIKTVVEYKRNDKGQKVKVTRKIKRTLVKTEVNHAVAERLALPKFGKAKGKENATATTVGETVRIKLLPGSKQQVATTEDEDLQNMRSKLQHKSIQCRICEGSHFTSRCPYKDTLGGVVPGGDDAAVGVTTGMPADSSAPGALSAGGKYVPPSMREGTGGSGRGRGGGESMYSRNRDDLPTLRVTNLSEDAVEEDLWQMFGRFGKYGKVVRIFVGRDQETGLCKGFAFVSFEDRRDAEVAVSKINGMPYDHLILSAAFSVPSTGDKGARR